MNRATAAAPGFSLDERNARAVAELCIQLDGVPLALELAAARMGSLSAEQLLDRIHERFSLLSQGPAVDARHRTLHDLVQWSFELLSPPEQLLLGRLSVFAGGFDLDAAERTAGDDDLAPSSVLALLSALVDKSLVVADTGDRVVRYRQLETIRRFGADQLDGRPEAARVRRAHRATFASLAEAAELGLDGPDEGSWSARLDRETDNLRGAVRTAVADGDADLGLRLVVAAREWSFRHMRYELVRWAEEVVELPGAQEHPLLPTALAVTAYGDFVRGELRGAVDRAERALGARVRLDRPTDGLAERVLGNALFFQGDRDGAQRWMERMIDAARESGNDARIAHALYMRSVARTSVGDIDAGEALAGEALAAARRAGSPTALSQATYAAGLARASLGDPAATSDGARPARRVDRPGHRGRQPVDAGLRHDRGHVAPGPLRGDRGGAHRLPGGRGDLVPERRLGQPVAQPAPARRHPRLGRARRGRCAPLRGGHRCRGSHGPALRPRRRRGPRGAGPAARGEARERAPGRASAAGRDDA